MNLSLSIYCQCQPAVVDEIFPGWQWRFVNPITKQEEEEYQPFNTTLPACISTYATTKNSIFGILLYVICYMLFYFCKQF